MHKNASNRQMQSHVKWLVHKHTWLTNAHIALNSQGNLCPHSYSRREEIGRQWKCQNQSANLWRARNPLRSAMLSRARGVLCVCDRLFVHLCVCVFQRRQQEGCREQISYVLFFFKIAGEDVDCNHLWCLSENNIMGTLQFLWHSTALHRGESLRRPTEPIPSAPVLGDPKSNRGDR